MNLIKKFTLLLLFLLLNACIYNETGKSRYKESKKFYSSKGFALIYDDSIFNQGIINRKLNNDEHIAVMHSFLPINTPIKIINPENLKTLETKVYKKARYPNLFNAVLSKKIAQILELDTNNPYIEIFEIKKNKTFIAKKSNTFEEEKKVEEVAPVSAVVIDLLRETETETSLIKKQKKESNFIIVISDFYYSDSATNLKDELFKQTQINYFHVKKINNNKYRLLAGPFKNFDALKSTYISLNNLGFEELDIYRE